MEKETLKEYAQTLKDEAHREEEYNECEECGALPTKPYIYGDEYKYLCKDHYPKI